MYVCTNTYMYSITSSQSGVLGPFLDNIMELAIQIQKVKLSEKHNPLLHDRTQT